jgi:TonB family protein
LKLVCVSLTHKVEGLGHLLDELFPTYCFTPEKLIFRMSTNLGGIETVSNQIALFQNRYVPRTVNVSTYGKPTLDIHLESLASLAPAQDAVFPPPSDAQKVDPDIARKEGDLKTVIPGAHVTPGKLLRSVPPIYPAEAKQLRAQGRVRLAGIIGTDGRLTNLALISAPDNLLVEAAAYAVSQWEYEPFQLNGLAIEVGTEVTIRYFGYQ